LTRRANHKKRPLEWCGTSVWTAAAAAFLLGVVALREHGAEGTRNFDADARKQERDARARVTQKVDH
jgi:hypothetical protein